MRFESGGGYADLVGADNTTLTNDGIIKSQVEAADVASGAQFQLNGGTADPILEGSYAPAVGTEFKVINGAWDAGAFATVTNDFSGATATPATSASCVRA